MAEVIEMRNNALPYPVYGLPWTVVFPLLDADGDPISPSSPDSEISLNGDDFVDCTNEAVEIATSSGVCYLILTAAEMTADVVTIQVKSTGAKTTILTLYPRKLAVVRTGTTQASSGLESIKLDSGASAVNDAYTGMVIKAILDGVTYVRPITTYNGINKSANVVPNVAVLSDTDDTFTIYQPEGVQVPSVNITHVEDTDATDYYDTLVDAILDTIRVSKNTALANFEFFMRDSADHVSGKTGLTITAERSIDGGAFAACANVAAEVSAGVYKIDLAATDLNGDVITFKFTSAGADPTLITIVTQPKD